MTTQSPCRDFTKLVQQAVDEGLGKQQIYRLFKGLDFHTEFIDVTKGLNPSGDEFRRIRYQAKRDNAHKKYPWNQEGDTFYINITNKANGACVECANVPCPPQFPGGNKEGLRLGLKDILWELKDDQKHCTGSCTTCKALEGWSY